MKKRRTLFTGITLLLLGIAGLFIVQGMSMSRHHRGMMGGMMGGSPPAVLDAESRKAPGAAAFRQTCSSCHALPAPSTHTAAEWPAVVARMEQHMIALGKAVPPRETLDEIIAFLQDHAR